MDVKTDPPSKVTKIYSQLGPNERAIVDKVKPLFLRNLFVLLINTKVQLQFSGWLQYLVPLPLTLLVLVIAGIVYLIGAVQLATYIAYVGGGLLFIIAFDIVTTKFHLRPPEPLPKRKDEMSIFDLMRTRRSCRSYQIRKLTPNDHADLMASVKQHSEEKLLGVSPVRFEYISAPLTVWPVVNASEFLVAIAPAKYDRLAVMDVGRTLQKIVIDATRMGLSTCWIGPGADHKSVVHHLGNRFDKQTDSIICVCAVGYRSWLIPLFIRIFSYLLRGRLSLRSLIFVDSEMNNPAQLDIEPIKKYAQVFEACQWSPSSYNGQTTRLVSILDDQGKVDRFDFYAVTASRYYAAVAVGIWCANWEMGCEALRVRGHFDVLTESERRLQNIQDQPQIPRYDVSWVSDE